MYRNTGSDFFSGILIIVTLFVLLGLAIQFFSAELLAIVGGLIFTALALTTLRS